MKQITQIGEAEENETLTPAKPNLDTEIITNQNAYQIQPGVPETQQVQENNDVILSQNDLESRESEAKKLEEKEIEVTAVDVQAEQLTTTDSAIASCTSDNKKVVSVDKSNSTAPEKLPLPQKPKEESYKLLSLEEMEENLFPLRAFGLFVSEKADVRSIAKRETNLMKINEEYRYFMGLMERRFMIHLKQIKANSSQTDKNHIQGKESRKADRDEDVENFPVGNHGDSGIDPSGKSNNSEVDEDDEEIDNLANLDTLEHDDKVASQASNKKNKKKQKSAEVKSDEDEGTDFDLSSLDSDSSSETDDPPLENLDDGSSDSDGSYEEYLRNQVKKSLMDFSESSGEELEESDDDRQAVVRKGLSSDSEEEKHPVKQEKLEEDFPDENDVPQASSSRRNSSQHEPLADEDSVIIVSESENQSKNEKDLEDRRFMQKFNRKLLQSDDSELEITGISQEPTRIRKHRKSRKSNITDYFVKKEKPSSDLSDDDLFAETSSQLPRRKKQTKILEPHELAPSTQRAQLKEDKRMKVLQKKSEALEKVRLSQAVLRSNRDEESGYLLDIDPVRKQKITVDNKLYDLLKPHQKEAVKFMYDSCWTTVKKVKATNGSGCILAHSK
jgi:hypothetical protein